MENREDILRSPAYWLQDLQLSLFDQVADYLKEHNLNQSQFADQLQVSKGYVSQILNGNLNCTLKKLVELSLAIGKVPEVTYTPIDEKIDEAANHLTYTLEFNQGGTISPQTMNIVYRNNGKEIAAA